jgi:hypothetical protein
MRRWFPTALLTATAAVVTAAVIGCADWGRTRPTLDATQPETRQRLRQVMARIGDHYLRLSGSVDAGNLSEVPVPAEAIAALGALLAPHRDPGMPEEYIVLQAQFDEASRELAAAARLKSLQEVSDLYREMRRTCRNCHVTFRVPLEQPLADLGYAPKSGG